MKICKDCEQSFEKLTREGICKKCYARRSNMRYHGKEYIAIKDLPPKKRMEILQNRETRCEKAEKERKTKKITSAKQGNETEVKKDTLLGFPPDVISRITKDVEEEMQRRDVINLTTQEDIDNLHIVANTLFNLCNNPDFILEKIREIDTYNNLTNDYSHALEECDFSEVTMRGLDLKFIQQIRRTSKNYMDLYLKSARELMEYLKGDSKIVDLIMQFKDNFEKTLNQQENFVYVAKASNSMLESDFVVNKREIIEKYDVSVPCYNLYGKAKKTLFSATGGISAKSPEEAKQKLIDLLRRDFPTVRFDENDIKVVPIYNKKENS